MDPTQRFSNRVENYRKYRPGYPTEVVDLIRKISGAATNSPVADIGSGTGIFTRKLLEAGLVVTAVEPNEPMRQAAETDLACFPGFHSIASSAEQTGLPEHYFIALTVAQAFHWFEPAAAQREFRRILQPKGWAFLIWNERTSKGSSFDRDYEALLATLGQSYEAVRKRTGEFDSKDFFVPDSYQEARFDNPHILTWKDLKGRFLSSSYVPTAEDTRHLPLISRLEEIFQKHQREGRVVFAQQTNVYYGHV